MSTGKYRHIVLLTLNKEVTLGQKEEIIRALNELEQEPGILKWSVRESRDTRKGVVLAVNSLFESEETFHTFRGSARHVAVGDLMRTHANWVVADYIE